MITDINLFNEVEKTLLDNGKLRAFENENGEVRGRMMITTSTIPEEIAGEIVCSDDITAFTASLDFYDMTMSVAVCTKTKKIVSGIWVTSQKENAEQPSTEWVSFFLEKVVEAIDEDGSFGVPIYSFITDTSDMTVVPSIH